MNVTFQWIRNHVPRCPLGLGVMCCLPTCVKSSSVPTSAGLAWPGFFLSVCLLVLLGAEAALCLLPLDPENHLVLNRQRLNTYEAHKEEIKGIIEGRVVAHIRDVQECNRIFAKVETPWMLMAS